MALGPRLGATLEGLGAYLIVLRKRFAMTLHILGIAVEEADNQQPECKANPIDQFWLAASDVLIEIVQRQPQIQPIIDAAIDAGGDIEITAHNQGGKISFATGASFGSGETTLMPVD